MLIAALCNIRRISGRVRVRIRKGLPRIYSIRRVRSLNFGGDAPWKENREAEDWEAVAEALGVAGRQESNIKPVKSGRAWMPDDVFRPSFFPPIANQRSFLVEQIGPKAFGNKQEQKNRWDRKPAWCPICTEDMDSTDFSFVPCKCGFRLCLFCYHRILSEGGQCPNCRSLYNLEYVLKLSSVVPSE